MGRCPGLLPGMAPGGIMPGCMGMGTMPGWPGMGRTMNAMGCPGPPPGMPGITGIICGKARRE